MRELQSVREEIARLVAASRIEQALSAKLPPSAWFQISSRDAVGVYRERSGRWESPFRVGRIVNKTIRLMDDHGTIRKLAVHQCLPVTGGKKDRDLEYDDCLRNWK